MMLPPHLVPQSVPHERGDEPHGEPEAIVWMDLFPTSVGMNRVRQHRMFYRNRLFPTSVGMNRP